MSMLKNIVEEIGVVPAEMRIRALIEKNEIKAEDINFRDLWESFVGPCAETFSCAAGHHQGFIDQKPVTEAAVKQSAFSNITGVLISKKVIEGYDLVDGIGDMLTTRYPSNLKDERFPGFIGLEDVETVDEGDQYQESGIGDKYAGTGTPLKKGRILSLTEEAIFFDQTGQLMIRAQKLGEKAALRKEKTILDSVVGAVACYWPGGVETALYGAAPYLVASNALVDWTDIENCELTGFAAMTDDSPESDLIVVVPKILLVPRALFRTAIRIMSATQVIHGDFDDATSIKTHSKSPYRPNEYRVVTSSLIHGIQGNSTSWYMGDPQQQFFWKEIFPLQTFRAAPNSTQEFERDVKARFKVRYYGGVFVADRRYFVRNTA